MTDEAAKLPSAEPYEQAEPISFGKAEYAFQIYSNPGQAEPGATWSRSVRARGGARIGRRGNSGTLLESTELHGFEQGTIIIVIKGGQTHEGLVYGHITARTRHNQQ